MEALLRDKDEELNRIRRQHSDDMSRRLEELRQLREYESTQTPEGHGTELKAMEETIDSLEKELAQANTALQVYCTYMYMSLCIV